MKTRNNLIAENFLFDAASVTPQNIKYDPVVEMADTSVFKTDAPPQGVRVRIPPGSPLAKEHVMARTKQMKALEEHIARKRAERDKLNVEIAALEVALKVTSGEPAVTKARAPRSNVKTLVLDLLSAVGSQGLNAATAVERAEAKGERLERGSVSSLLSRLKAEGVVFYDGSVYRLTKFREGAADVSGASPLH